MDLDARASVGRVPSWWLSGVDHETMEIERRQEKLRKSMQQQLVDAAAEVTNEGARGRNLSASLIRRSSFNASNSSLESSSGGRRRNNGGGGDSGDRILASDQRADLQSSDLHETEYGDDHILTSSFLGGIQEETEEEQMGESTNIGTASNTQQEANISTLASHARDSSNSVPALLDEEVVGDVDTEERESRSRNAQEFTGTSEEDGMADKNSSSNSISYQDFSTTAAAGGRLPEYTTPGKNTSTVPLSPGIGSSTKLNITISAEEEAALVESRREAQLQSRQLAESFGQKQLRSRAGGVKVRESFVCAQDRYNFKSRGEGFYEDPIVEERAETANLSEAQVQQESASAEKQKDDEKKSSDTPQKANGTVSTDSKALSPSGRSGQSTPTFKKTARKFKTAFTGVSHFDFAMQQRAQEQERRAKEREAREALARHHEQLVMVDKVTELKRNSEEEKRKKKEAEENLKGFKARHL